MNTLIDKIRKARESTVSVGDLNFLIRRPTDMEVVELQRADSELKQSDLLKRFVVGWDGVKELDIIPGGTGAEVQFDSDLFVEWIVDKPKCWTPICDAITQCYTAHIEKMADSEKKPSAG